MHDAGLPVPQHFFVSSPDSSVAAAEKLTFPVVVKPADKDGGLGVSSDPTRCPRGSQSILSAGSTTLKTDSCREIHTRERLPIAGCGRHGSWRFGAITGVVGNGQNTVRQLVEQQNFERKNATDDRRFSHAIEIDEEAERMLNAAFLNCDSVPVRGSFVRLRGASNVASGGIPHPIPVEEVHPDNIALVVRAVRVLRLDVAGVDLLMPDIRESWLSSGAGICEVNSQPQMFTTLHAPMLRSIMRDTEGRIPVAIVLATKPGERVSTMLHEQLCKTFPATGFVSSEKILLGKNKIMASNPGNFLGSNPDS